MNSYFVIIKTNEPQNQYSHLRFEAAVDIV